MKWPQKPDLVCIETFEPGEGARNISRLASPESQAHSADQRAWMLGSQDAGALSQKGFEGSSRTLRVTDLTTPVSEVSACIQRVDVIRSEQSHLVGEKSTQPADGKDRISGVPTPVCMVMTNLEVFRATS
jgi:hypothetical protein